MVSYELLLEGNLTLFIFFSPQIFFCLYFKLVKTVAYQERNQCYGP